MFYMAADVAAYADFLPLISQSSVFDMAETNDLMTFKGRLDVERKSLNIAETFDSDVVADKNQLSIVSTASNGLVKRLINTWHFVDLPEGGSQSRMVLDYEISSLPLRIIINAASGMVMEKMAQAFEKRADKLYG